MPQCTAYPAATEAQGNLEGTSHLTLKPLHTMSSEQFKSLQMVVLFEAFLDCLARAVLW
jgi:hypothetical protein